MYWRRLAENPKLTFRLENSQRYTGIDLLLDEDFLVASADYLNWVRAQRVDRLLYDRVRNKPKPHTEGTNDFQLE